jgi:hypothetical protein
MSLSSGKDQAASQASNTRALPPSSGSSSSSSSSSSSRSSSDRNNRTGDRYQLREEPSGDPLGNAFGELTESVSKSINSGGYVLDAPSVIVSFEFSEFIKASSSRSDTSPVTFNTWILSCVMINVLHTVPSTRKAIEYSFPNVGTENYSHTSPWISNMFIESLKINPLDDRVIPKILSNENPANNPPRGAYKNHKAVAHFFGSSDPDSMVTIVMGLLMSSQKKQLSLNNSDSITKVHGLSFEHDHISKLCSWVARAIPKVAVTELGKTLISFNEFYRYHTTMSSTPGLVLKFYDNAPGELKAMISQESVRMARHDIEDLSNQENYGHYNEKDLAIVYAHGIATKQSWASPIGSNNSESKWYQGSKAAQSVGQGEVARYVRIFKDLMAVEKNLGGVVNARSISEARRNAANLIGSHFQDYVPAENSNFVENPVGATSAPVNLPVVKPRAPLSYDDEDEDPDTTE